MTWCDNTKFFCSWCGCKHKLHSAIAKAHVKFIRKNEHKVYRRIAKSLGD